jgi:hypothetical protein
VDLSLKHKIVSINIHTEDDAEFFNIMFMILFSDLYLFNYMLYFDYMVILVYVVCDICYI